MEGKERHKRRSDTRCRILDAALRSFSARGYASTTMNDIASALGVTSAALYYHFEGKDAILRALVDPLADAVDDLIARAPGVGTTAGSRRELLSLYLSLLIEWRPLVGFVVQDPAVLFHPEVGQRLEAQQAALQRTLAGGPEGRAAAAASAALGALWRPVLALPVDELVRQRKVIVDAAVRALGAALPDAARASGSPTAMGTAS